MVIYGAIFAALVLYIIWIKLRAREKRKGV